MILYILRPLPSSLRGQSCNQCNKLQASWELPVKSQDQVLICSLCVLYDPTVWNDFVKTTITEIEVSRDKMFDRSSDAKLIHTKDADDVVGVLVLTARVSGLGVEQSGPRGP